MIRYLRPLCLCISCVTPAYLSSGLSSGSTLWSLFNSPRTVKPCPVFLRRAHCLHQRTSESRAWMQYFNCISAVHPTHFNHARNVPYNYEWRHPRLSMTRWIFVAKSSAMQFKFDFAKYSPESLRLHYAKKHLSFSVLPAFCILFLKTKFLSILSLCLHLFYLKGYTKIFISNDLTNFLKMFVCLLFQG